MAEVKGPEGNEKASDLDSATEKHKGGLGVAVVTVSIATSNRQQATRNTQQSTATAALGLPQAPPYRGHPKHQADTNAGHL